MINLEKNHDRMLIMHAQLKRLGIEYDRVDALYGKDMDSESKRRAVSAFRWHCGIGRSARDAEIGCALSHYKIYQRMIDEDIGVACIMEDDVVLGDDANRVLRELQGLLDVQQPIVYLLSDHSRDGQMGIMKLAELNMVSGSPVSLIKSKHDWGTECYCITKIAARNILRWNFPLKVPCDYWAKFVKRRLVRLYWVKPTIATQDKEGFVSDIMPKMYANKRRNCIARWFRLPVRAVEKFVDRLLDIVNL